MVEYRKSEAREWARAKMRGVANVITPTFTQDLRDVNERAIRHDVRAVDSPEECVELS